MPSWRWGHNWPTTMWVYTGTLGLINICCSQFGWILVVISSSIVIFYSLYIDVCVWYKSARTAICRHFCYGFKKFELFMHRLWVLTQMWTFYWISAIIASSSLVMFTPTSYSSITLNCWYRRLHQITSSSRWKILSIPCILGALNYVGWSIIT